MKYLISILLITIVGCSKTEIDLTEFLNNKKIVEEIDKGVSERVTDALLNVSEENCVKLYKIYKGCAEFVKNTSLESTLDLNELISEVQKGYAFKQEGSFVELTRELLEREGLADKDGYPLEQNIKNEREKIVKFFDTIADGIKNAIEKKGV